MLKKSLLSLAVAASLAGVSGCNISSTSGNNDVSDIQPQNRVYPLFDPASSVLPLGSDILMAAASTSDGTANSGASGTDSQSAVTDAFDRMDGGIGVTTPIDLAMNGSIDTSTINAGQVLLVRLANSSDNALIDALDIRDILGQGTGAIPTTGQPVLGTDYRVEAISVDEGSNNVIRIVPLKPLQAKTKYLAIVTTSVQDTEGRNIPVQPNFDYIVGEDALFNPAFVPVRSALQAWLGLATAATQKSADEISFVQAFTTVSTDSVMLGMAVPETAANSFVSGAILSSVKSEVRANTALDQTDFATVWATIEAGFTAQAATVAAAQAGVAAQLTNLSTPADRDTHFAYKYNAAFQVDDVAAGLPNAGIVTQGQIELPYYLAAPARAVEGQDATANGAAAIALQATDWTADDDVGQTLKTILTTGQPQEVIEATIIPPQDVDETTNVNGRFPFAKEVTQVTAPILVHLPDTDNDGTPQCGGTTTLCPVVIYQHGIGGNRSHSLPLANSIGLAGFATIAMDLPLHGVAPLISGVTDPALPFSVDVGAWPTGLAAVGGVFSDLGERHFGYGSDASGVATPLIYDDAATTDIDEAAIAAAYPSLITNNSAAHYINLSNFTVTRDIIRQSSMDLLNLAASIADMDYDEDGIPDFDATKVHFVGHSLGSIVGTTFANLLNSARAAGNTALPALNTVSLVTPGGQFSRLLENSPSFAGLADATSPVDNTGALNADFGLLAKLSAATGGVVKQGTSSFESFMNVFQATLDGVDPVVYGGGAALAAQPILAIEVVGDNGVQVIDGTSINKPDQTIPNSADTGSTWEGANPAPLAGTDPLITELGLATFTDTTIGAATYTDDNRVVLKLKKGTHSSIIVTSGDSTADEGSVAKETYDNTSAAQAATIGSIVSFITTVGAGGTGVSLNNSADVVASE